MADPILIFAFIEVESMFNPKAFANDKNGGSYGLTQLNLATAADRGYTGTAIGLYDPPTNIKYGVAVLDWLTAELAARNLFSIENLAAAYNSGLTHVLGGGADSVYSGKITAAYARWKMIFGVKT